MDQIIHELLQLPPFTLNVIRLALWLLALSFVFVIAERVWWLRTQKVARKGLLADLFYYFLNSLLPKSSDFHLNTAYFINDSGQIIATGTDARGVLNEYLLTESGMPTPGTPRILTVRTSPLPEMGDETEHLAIDLRRAAQAPDDGHGPVGFR